MCSSDLQFYITRLLHTPVTPSIYTSLFGTLVYGSIVISSICLSTEILDNSFGIKDLNSSLCCEHLVPSATVTGYFTTVQMVDIEVVQKVLSNQGQLLGHHQQVLADVNKSATYHNKKLSSKPS